LQFLFETETSNLLNELLVEEDRFFEALRTANERSKVHLNELQPELAELGLKHTDVVTASELEEKLSPNTLQVMKSLTSALIKHADEGIDGLKAMYSKLRDAFVKLFPGKIIIEFQFPD
jgi:hypothetical protein